MLPVYTSGKVLPDGQGRFKAVPVSQTKSVAWEIGELDVSKHELMGITPPSVLHPEAMLYLTLAAPGSSVPNCPEKHFCIVVMHCSGSSLGLFIIHWVRNKWIGKLQSIYK